MRADPRLPLLLLLVCLGSAAAPARRGHADEAPVAPPRPPEPPGTYAGKDAAWWIGELRDPEMHKGALQALQLVGRDAADALIRALDDEDPAVRTALAGLLRRLTPPATIPSDVLARRLAVEEHESAIHGLLLLAPQATPTRPLVEGLLRHVGSDNPRVRQAACTVLGGLRLEAQHIPPALQQLAVEGDLAQATAALRVLAALPGTRALLEQAGLALLGREQEPDMRLVQEAMQLLLRAGLRSKELTAALQSAAGRWQGPGAGAALQSLVELAQQEPTTGALVLEALRGTNEERRSVALGLLERSPLVVQAAPGPLVLELLAARRRERAGAPAARPRPRRLEGARRADRPGARARCHPGRRRVAQRDRGRALDRSAPRSARRGGRATSWLALRPPASLGTSARDDRRRNQRLRGGTPASTAGRLAPGARGASSPAGGDLPPATLPGRP